MRNDLAFSCMVMAVTSVEKARMDRDEGVVKVGLGGAGSVAIDGV